MAEAPEATASGGVVDIDGHEDLVPTEKSGAIEASPSSFKSGPDPIEASPKGFKSEKDRQAAVTSAYAQGDVESLAMCHGEIDLDLIDEHKEVDTGMGGDYIKSFVLGGLDGIVSTFALVAGLSGANTKLTTLIAVGVAKVLADAFSMGFSEFTSASAELEHTLMVKDREEWEMEENLEGEVKEMAALYIKSGVTKTDAVTMLTIMARYKELFLEHMLVMEHGLMSPESDRWAPVKQGLICFVSFILFGLVPLLGFIVAYAIDPTFADGGGIGNVLGLAYCLTVVTLFIMGVAKAKLTFSPKLFRSGTIMVINGSIAGGIAYLIGDILTETF